MPFLRFKRTEAEFPPVISAGPELLKEGPFFARWYITYRLEEETERARRYGRPLALAVALAPRQFVVEQRRADVLAAATEAAQASARSTDLLGWLDGESFLMIMPETTPADAEAAVVRWRNEMWLRSRRLGGQKWSIAVLPSPVEFESAEQFTQSIPQMLEQREAA